VIGFIMKIKTVQAKWIHVPIPDNQQHRSDFGVVASFDMTLIRIETECGLIGHGEAKATVASAGDNRALSVMIEQELGPALIGQDCRQISKHWENLYSGVRGHYALDRGHVFPILGRRGITISAISGIDMALWDLLGQSLNAPVWQLLGGRRHETMPAYASGGWADVNNIGQQLKSYIDRGGFKAVKMRIGVADGEVRHSVERVKAAREALGEDVDLMCDAHGTYTVSEAKRFCRMVEELNIAWFEEPVTADDKKGLKEIRASTDIPIATGENEATRFAFRDLADLRAADIFQPDLAICGGITEAMRIAAIASANQILLAPHLWGGALMFAAGLQVCAASPAAHIIEYSLGANPILFELAEQGPVLKDGMVEIPDRPGLGVTINDDFVKEYTV
jgi:L-alanine-DL-glutamate epimerase-like enolase superfamily enzyme